MKIFFNSLDGLGVTYPFWDAAAYGLAPDADCDTQPATFRSLTLSANQNPLHHALLVRSNKSELPSPATLLAGKNTADGTVRSSSQMPFLHLGNNDDDEKDGGVVRDLRAIVTAMARAHEPKDPDERFAHVYLRPAEKIDMGLKFRLNALQTALRALTYSRDVSEFPASETSWHRLLNAWDSWIFGDTTPNLSTPARIAQARAASFSAIFWGFTAKFLEVTWTRETLNRVEWQALANRLLNLPWLCEAGDVKKQDAYFTLIKMLGVDTLAYLDLDGLAKELHLRRPARQRLREAFFRCVPMTTEQDVDRVMTYLRGLTGAIKRKAYQDLQANPYITPEAKTILARYVENLYTTVTVAIFASSTSTEN